MNQQYDPWQDMRTVYIPKRSRGTGTLTLEGTPAVSGTINIDTNKLKYSENTTNRVVITKK